MKKSKKLIFILIIIMLVIISVVFIIKNNKQENSFNEIKKVMKREEFEITDSSDKKEKKEVSTTLTTQAEIKSALTEKIELHTTYYLEEKYIQENQYVKKGEKILKYTNNTYLTAPYDCYIISTNLPDEGEKVLNSHYVEISSGNVLMINMSIDETNIQNISIGLETTIEITSLNKQYTGYVTKVASTGNNGKFQIEIEFENDGDVKIGMSGKVYITI